MSGDESGHRCSVAVIVLSAVAVGSGEVFAGQYAAGEVWVACVDAGVDDAHDHALTLAVGVRLGDVEEAEVPFAVADRVGHRRCGEHERRDGSDQNGRNGAEEPVHRSIPMTPGPGSCSVGSGNGSSTAGPPSATAHG